MRTQRKPGIARSWREAFRWLGKILLAGTVTWAVTLAVIFGAYAITCAPAEAQGTDSATRDAAERILQGEGETLYSPKYIVYDSTRIHDGVSEELREKCSAPDAPPNACVWGRHIALSYRSGAEDVRARIRGNSLHLDSLARENGWKRVRCNRIFPKLGDGAVGCLMARAKIAGQYVGAEHGEP